MSKKESFFLTLEIHQMSLSNLIVSLKNFGRFLALQVADVSDADVRLRHPD